MFSANGPESPGLLGGRKLPPYPELVLISQSSPGERGPRQQRWLQRRLEKSRGFLTCLLLPVGLENKVAEMMSLGAFLSVSSVLTEPQAIPGGPPCPPASPSPSTFSRQRPSRTS